MKIGKYLKKRTCRLCSGRKFNTLIDLGYMPHAGDFLKKSEIGKEYYYPLRIWQCQNCKLVQILDVIPPQVLFRDYHYLSSVALSEHFDKYAHDVFSKFLNNKSFVVDIGSNDGVLLSPLKKMGASVIGVDASINVAKLARKRGLETIIGGFNEKIARMIVKKKGQADAVFANNVLAHIDDIKEVFRGIQILLKKNGIMVIEVHYFPDLVAKLQYDFFYNEHLIYYTIATLSRLMKLYGLVPFDLKRVSTHSGSIRVYVKHQANKKYLPTKRLKDFIDKEKKNNPSLVRKLINFSDNVNKHKKNLLDLIAEFKNKNVLIVGYGASGRANTLLNYCGLDNSMVSYIVDESQERYGRYTPGTHIPIVKPDIFRKDKKNKTVLLLAWNYKEQIMEKERGFIEKGGKFIIPFPKVSIV